MLHFRGMVLILVREPKSLMPNGCCQRRKKPENVADGCEGATQKQDCKLNSGDSGFNLHLRLGCKFLLYRKQWWRVLKRQLSRKADVARHDANGWDTRSAEKLPCLRHLSRSTLLPHTSPPAISSVPPVRLQISKSLLSQECQQLFSV